MAKWFYFAGGQPAGPIDSAALKQLAASGRLKPTDKVRREDLADWYEAKQVNGLFPAAQSQAVSSASAATTTAQRSPGARHSAIDGNVPASILQTVGSIAEERPLQESSYSPNGSQCREDEDEATGMAATTKIVLAICVAIGIPILGYFLWFVALRDTWELNNAVELTARLDEANRLQQSDAFAAYKIYDEVIKETHEHELTNADFIKRIADAEKSRTALYQKVQEKIRAEEADKVLQAEAQSRREAAEKQRLAQEEQRKRAAEEAQRVAEDNRRAEEKRRMEAAAVYRNPPETARVALNAVKKVAARVEIGINYTNYSSVMGDTWADVKIFIESADGRKLPDFTKLLTRAMADYKLALDVWHDKIRYSSLYGKRTDVDVLQQVCWMQADACIKLAESLLDSDDKAKALELIATGLSNAKDLDAEWNKIQKDVLNR